MKMYNKISKYDWLNVSLIIFICGNLYAQTIPTPPQTQQISKDINSNSKADPGDSIRYKVTIQNTGAAPATAVQLQANTDTRTTLNPSSFRSSPIAVNDGPYVCTGNVGINIPAASGVKANDFDDNLAVATLSIVTPAASGSVMLNNDGSFTYTPNAGFTGNDQFTYEITDATAVVGHTPASADIRGTVSITVSNMIWFISNISGGSGGTGTRLDPFRTLADFNASAGTATGHVVHLQYTGTNYPGGIVLKNDMRLFGTGHTGGVTLADVLPFVLAPNSPTLPAINGARPVITNASGDGVILADGNTLRGFNVGNCSDFGIENSGTTTVGNLVVSEVTINNTTGGGFDASHGSGTSMNAVFDAISSNGGTNGINLTSCAGTFTCNGGTITNPTGTGVLISGGTVTFSSSGAITDNSGFAVDVDNHDSANSVTFSGNITSTGTGIRVQNCGAGTKLFSGSSKSLNTGTNAAVTLSTNNGATINFTNGGLAITTTSGTGFNATGGATAITVQGTFNTITSTTGTALNVTSTTIGASGMTFRSISTNGAANSIVLNNAGSGGLTVTGDGGGSNNGSGGTIQNCTGAGVSLTSVSNVSLNYMIIQNGSDDGVRGASVTNFSMNRSNVTNNGNGLDESGLDFGVVDPATLGLTGTSSLTNCSITSNYSNQVQVFNNSGSLTMTVTSCTINGRAAENNNNDGMLIQPNGTASITISVTSCSFAANKGDHLQGAAANSGNLTVIFKSNTLTGGHSSALGQGITINAATGVIFGGYSGTINYDVDGNNFNGAISNSVSIVQGTSSSAAVFSGFVRNNIIGTSGVSLSGSTQANGIYVDSRGNGNHTSSVTGNTIRQCFDRGILLEAGDGSPTVNLTIQSNIIDQQVDMNAREAIQTNFGITSTNVFGVVDAPVVCLQLGGGGALANTFSHGAGAPDDFRLRKRHNATVRLPGYAGGTGQDMVSLDAVVAFIRGQNTGSVGEPGSAAASGGGGGYTGGGACIIP